MSDDDKGFKERCELQRKASGSVDDTRPLVGLLYILMRDHVPPGTIETLMEEHIERAPHGDKQCYTNGWLAQHAQDLATRLQPPPDIKEVEVIPDWHRAALEHVKKMLNFHRSSFSRIHTDKDDQLPKNESEVDAFIDHRTKLWRSSWVFPLIDAMLTGDEGIVRDHTR